MRLVRGHHSTSKRPLSRWRGHVSSASMLAPTDVWPLRVPLTHVCMYMLAAATAHMSGMHTCFSAATESLSGVARRSPIPPAHVGPARPEQRSDPAGRALRASTEIPVSRLRRAGSGCLHRCRDVDCTCRCHGVCCPQDVSPRAPCSSFPRWGQSPVPPSSCHRRQKFALIRSRRRAGCWPGADLFLRHTNAHVSTKSGRACNEVDPLVYLRSF